MKNIIIILFFVLVPALSKSYTWQSICPDSIEANNIYFGAGGVICSPGGMYLWEEDIEQWIFYTYGLPVNGAAWLDGYKILVVMGNGSWSDGIYTFDLATHQFEVVAWVVTPRFIMVIPVLDQKSNLFTDEYHVGSQFGGLYRSIDGYNWTEIPYFLGKSCTAMDFYGEHLVVSETGSFTNVHWSDDYGATWQEADSPPVITDLKFNNSGELYGIFPGFSNSSGLYKSVDFGNNWEVEFWSDNMSSVGFDAIGTIFVGWESPFGGKEGIAVYDPLAPPPGLTFMNNGLASTNINKILLNPAMSNISIFCCTDSGVYMCNDYLVGENEVSQPDFQPQIYPNPLDDQHLLTISLSQSEQISAIEIFTSGGSLIYKTILTANESTNSYELDLSYLNSGVYLIRIKNRHSSVTRKFVIR